jgi:hypothetical protein
MTDAVSPAGAGGGPKGMSKPKRAWPLFLLAGAAFLPGFGVLFGAAIEAYHREQGRYPVRLATFTQLPYSLRLINIQDFSVGVFSRPREYRYDLAPDGRTYTLFAVGADGRPGTADDLFPELPDSVVGHSGYRSP